jgi:hypothetical protein
MFSQNDNVFSAVPDLQHYACRFFSLARAREIITGKPWAADELIKAWKGARTEGIISGDLNGDGDYDDAGEDEILDDAALIQYLRLPLRTISVMALGLSTMIDSKGVTRTAPQAAPLDLTRYWVLERWVWKIGHFIQGDGTGKSAAIYDPIRGGSLTRANGKIESLRVYLIN